MITLNNFSNPINTLQPLGGSNLSQSCNGSGGMQQLLQQVLQILQQLSGGGMQPTPNSQNFSQNLGGFNMPMNSMSQPPAMPSPSPMMAPPMVLNSNGLPSTNPMTLSPVNLSNGTPSGMTDSQAVTTLKKHFNDSPFGFGGPGGTISKTQLADMSNGMMPDGKPAPPDLQQAAKQLLPRFDQLDTAKHGGDGDGKISLNDLKAFQEKTL